MESELAEAMTDWLQIEYGGEFDFSRISEAIEVMLVNHKTFILNEG